MRYIFSMWIYFGYIERPHISYPLIATDITIRPRYLQLTGNMGHTALNRRNSQCQSKSNPRSPLKGPNMTMIHVGNGTQTSNYHRLAAIRRQKSVTLILTFYGHSKSNLRSPLESEYTFMILYMLSMEHQPCTITIYKPQSH